MGQGTSTAQQQDLTELLQAYSVESKCEQGTLLKHKTSKETFLLKEVSFMDQEEYRKALDKYRNKKKGPAKENLLNIIEVEGRVKTNFCSGTYKLYIIYEYPTITLQEEIQARVKETRFFDEQDLWSITQSCLNGISELGEPVLLQPRRIFIMNDGLVKIVDPDAISDGTRFVMSEGVYYAPERFENFNRADRGNSSEKETMFSLGMSLLESAILDECFDCYNYESMKFQAKKLEERINRLTGLYSDEFIFVIGNLLELNANRRSSILELQDVINKFWSKEEQSEQEEAVGESDSQKADEEEQPREPTLNTLKADKPHENEPVVNFNRVVKIKEAEFQMTNKVTFSEITDVDKPEPPRQSVTNRLTYIKEVNSGFESQISSRVEDFNTRRELLRRPLEAVENQYIMQEPAKHQHTHTDSKYAAALGTAASTAPPTYLPSMNASSSLTSAIPPYISSLAPPPYVPTYTYMNPISPSFYYPPAPAPVSSSSNQNLFTDPKLLELLRKDLSEINTRRTLSRQNTYESQLYQPTATYNPSSYLSPIQAFEQSNTKPVESATGRNSLMSHHNLPHHQHQLSAASSYPRVEMVKEVYEDGRIYEGPILSGMKEGEGKLTYPDGAYYEGNFSKNKMHGYGTLYYRIGKPAYEGHWHQDQFHGKGVLYNENPVQQLQPFDYSDFNLVEDYWIRYEGEFEYDNKHGPGRLLLANGEYFEGQFEKDCIHGQGKFYDKYGGVHTGTWDTNVLDHIQ